MRPFQRELRSRQIAAVAPPANPVVRTAVFQAAADAIQEGIESLQESIESEIVMSQASGDIPNGRAITDSATVTWDRSVPGEIKANAAAPTFYNQTIEDEGTPVTQRDTLNFVGAGVSVSDVGGKSTVSIPGGAGEAFPIGSVFISVVSTDPATLLGYGTWAAFGAGRVLVGLDSGDADFDTAEETGGAKTVAAAGSVAAPTLSGDTAAEAAHTHSVTSNVTVADHASHTHAYTEVPNHVHPLATGTGSTGNFSQVIGTVDTSSGGTGATPTQTALGTRSGNPVGGVASGTTAGPSATLTHSPTNNAVTSGAGSSHSHGRGTLEASAPAFTGSPTSVVQPYIVCYFWKRTA